MAATTNARTGATSAGTTTLPSRPSVITALPPAAARVAPTTPPISAWEELDGSPKYQVMTFQVIAPISPPNTIAGACSTTFGSTIPLATVAATFSETNAPTKLRSDAIAIAIRGGTARVEIDVATTFAVS